MMRPERSAAWQVTASPAALHRAEDHRFVPRLRDDPEIARVPQSPALVAPDLVTWIGAMVKRPTAGVAKVDRLAPAGERLRSGRIADRQPGAIRRARTHGVTVPAPYTSPQMHVAVAGGSLVGFVFPLLQHQAWRWTATAPTTTAAS